MRKIEIYSEMLYKTLTYKKNIMRLFDMVPNELKSELEWNPHNFEKMSTIVDSHNAKCRCHHAED